MENLTTTAILSLFETTKDERKSFVSDLIQRIEMGNANPINIHLQIKCMEDIIKTTLADPRYRDCLVDRSIKEGGRFTFHNSKFEIKEAGSKYDYTLCNDKIYETLRKKAYVELSKELEEITIKVKEREKFLKSIPSAGQMIVDADTGEISTLYPPSKTSTTTVSVTLL